VRNPAQLKGRSAANLGLGAALGACVLSALVLGTFFGRVNTLPP
jgi:hypothetical protein